MKKALFFAGLAAATLSFVGCNKEADYYGRGGRFEIVLNTEDTRTAIDGMNTVWVDSDQISVFHALAGTSDYKNDTPYADNKQHPFKVADAETGVFTGELLGGDLVEGQSYDWYLFYPYNSYLKSPVNTEDGRNYIGCAGNQQQRQDGNDNMDHLAGGANTGSFPLYGIATNVPAGTRPQVAMKHIASAVAVKVTNVSHDPVSILSVKLTAPEAIVGNYYISFEKTPVTLTPYEDQQSNTVTLQVQNGDAIPAGGSATFYMGIKPFTAAAGSELTLEVTGSNGVVTATKTLTAAAVFTAGKIKTLNVDYDKDHVESEYEWVKTTLDKVSETDEFVFVGHNADGEWALANDKGTSSAPTAISVEDVEGKLKNEPTANIIWTLTQGANAGEYAFSPKDAATFLYTTNTNNGVRVGTNDNHFFVLDAGYLKNVATSRYVGIYTSQDWRCYTSINSNIEGQTFAPYVKYKKGTVTPEKIFQASWAGAEGDGQNLKVPASATSATIVINADDDIAWTVMPSEGLTLSATEGTGSTTLTVTFPANTTSTVKEYSVLVGTQATGVQNDEWELTIEQEGQAVIDDPVYVKVSAVTSGKKYIIAATVNGVGKAMTPVSGNYGYASATDVVIQDGKIGERAESLEFTFSSVEGGFTIVQPDGRYVAMNGNYNSFNIYDSPQQAYKWAVTANQDGTVDIQNVEKSKHVVYDGGHSNFAAYASVNESNVYPALYEYVGSDTPSTPVDPTFTVPSTLTVEAGKTAKINVTTNTDGAITYTSASTAVATVAADGTVTGVAAGATTITVAAAATSAYNAASATVAVTVTEAQTGGHYGKVNTITSGKKYLIVSGGKSGDNYYAMVPPASTTAGRPAGAVVTISDGKIASDATTDSYAVTLNKSGEDVSIVLPNGNYLVYSGSGTGVMGAETASDFWNVAPGMYGSFRLVVKSLDTRSLAFRGGDSSNCFGAYMSNNVNGTEYFDVDLYELGAEPASGPVDPSFSVSSSIHVEVGQTAEISVTTNSDGAVSYSSSAPSIATVDAAGKVTGVAAGTATITVSVAATANFNAASKQVPVTVTAGDAGLTFNLAEKSETTGTDSWPTAVHETAVNAVYSLDGTNYTFNLGPETYMGVYSGTVYLMVKKGSYLGLPAIAGKKLVNVKVKTSANASTSTKGTVCKNADGTSPVSSTVALDQKNSYFSWALTGTEANTMYYIVVSSANSQYVELVLTYE